MKEGMGMNDFKGNPRLTLAALILVTFGVVSFIIGVCLVTQYMSFNFMGGGENWKVKLGSLFIICAPVSFITGTALSVYTTAKNGFRWSSAVGLLLNVLCGMFILFLWILEGM